MFSTSPEQVLQILLYQETIVIYNLTMNYICDTVFTFVFNFVMYFDDIS